MDWGTFLFGGGSQSPQDYAQKNPYSSQIQHAYNTGMHIQAPQINAGPQDQFRNAQLAQLNQLQGIASGQQQGAGELAAQRQVQNALSSQQAMARLARGQNAGLAARNAAINSANIGLSGAGQSQQAALQDQMNAQGMLSNVANQGRGSDIQIASQNAQMQQQQDQLKQQWAQLLSQMGQGELGAQMQGYSAAQNNPGILGGLLNAGGQLGGAAILHSDERLKKNIEPADNEVDELMEAMLPKAYIYKDSKHGTGRRIGVMAQDLEKSKAGRQISYEATDGKALDVNKAISAALAAVGRLHRRVKKVESR